MGKSRLYGAVAIGVTLLLCSANVMVRSHLTTTIQGGKEETEDSTTISSIKKQMMQDLAVRVVLSKNDDRTTLPDRQSSDFMQQPMSTQNHQSIAKKQSSSNLNGHALLLLRSSTSNEDEAPSLITDQKTYTSKEKTKRQRGTPHTSVEQQSAAILDGVASTTSSVAVKRPTKAPKPIPMAEAASTSSGSLIPSDSASQIKERESYVAENLSANGDTTTPKFSAASNVVADDTDNKAQSPPSSVLPETGPATYAGNRNEDEDTYFFHCDDPRSNCTYFNPHQFFESKEGAGYPYRDLAHRQTYGMSNRTVDINYCRASLKEGMAPPRPNFPKDLAYIHVHKAGGITLRYTFDMFPASYRIGSNYSTERIFAVQAKELGPVKMEENMRQMAELTVLFSFIRDPVDRFVSAASELAYQGSAVKRGKGKCYGADHGAGYMQCFLDKLIAGEFVDAHLLPQAIELYPFGTGNPTTKIALFTMASISEVQHNMGIVPFAGNKKKGVKAKYTVDTLTSEMIRSVCHHYKMDVAMVRAVGIPVPRCP